LAYGVTVEAFRSGQKTWHAEIDWFQRHNGWMQSSTPQPPAHSDGLLANWNISWSTLGLAPPASLIDELLSAWAEPSRHYHSLQHLTECIAWFERTKDTAERPAEVALALWFHDAIYDVQAHDNEQRSANWARDALHAACVPEDVTTRIHALVMATQHQTVLQGRDTELLVDIDLAILGASPARFAEYEQQIRAEYAYVPPTLFEPRRRDILRRFFECEPLYSTAAMHAACEARAKTNLLSAIG